MKLTEKKSLLALPLAAALSACGGSDENIQNITNLTQGEVWEKVFEGTVTDPAKIEQHPANPRWVKLQQPAPVTYEALRKLAAEGAEFKTVKSVASGGGGALSTYSCGEIAFYDNDRVFTCYGPQISSGSPQNATFESVSVGFDQGSAWYVPAENEPDFAMTIDLSFWAGKNMPWASKNTPDSGAQE